MTKFIHWSVLKALTHYQMINFRLFQTKKVCRRQFQMDENGRKLSKGVENTVGKGEIAHYEQFFLFPQCFQKACFPGASKGVIVWEWINPFPNKSRFLCVCSICLLKTLWTKEKLLQMSNFFPTMFTIRLKILLRFSSK